MSRARNEKRKLGEFNTHTEDKRSRGKPTNLLKLV